MSYIWLRYKDGATIVDRRFNAVTEYNRTTVDRLQGRTLRHTDYSHRLSRRRAYDVAISADELVVIAAMEYIEAFWEAEQWWISLDESTTVPDDAQFVECTIPSGDLPVTYIRSHKRLPRVAFTMTEKRKR
jgi:hypothetical protein